MLIEFKYLQSIEILSGLENFTLAKNETENLMFQNKNLNFLPINVTSECMLSIYSFK